MYILFCLGTIIILHYVIIMNEYYIYILCNHDKYYIISYGYIWYISLLQYYNSDFVPISWTNKINELGNRLFWRGFSFGKTENEIVSSVEARSTVYWISFRKNWKRNLDLCLFLVFRFRDGSFQEGMVERSTHR